MDKKNIVSTVSIGPDDVSKDGFCTLMQTPTVVFCHRYLDNPLKLPDKGYIEDRQRLKNNKLSALGHMKEPLPSLNQLTPL